MLARSGPLDEKSSPVMVVAQTRCRNIAKSQELAKEKLKVTSAEFRVHQSLGSKPGRRNGWLQRPLPPLGAPTLAQQRRRRPPSPRYRHGSYRPPALPIF